MKNIHILQTDKPSRLAKSTKSGINATKTGEGLYESGRFGITTYNIYITSDEEINVGDYVYSIRGFVGKFGTFENSYQNECKKIILTTDQDLIKGGVQAIDDEFLEWFVSVPFGEIKEVEVEDNREISNEFIELDTMSYKIIIPKEEKTKCYCGHTTTCDCGPEEPKQETLEEAIERLFIYYPESSGYRKAALIGKEWQQEQDVKKMKPNPLLMDEAGHWDFRRQQRSYSEEDLREAFKYSRQAFIFEKDMPCVYDSFEEWFEQFSKLKNG